MLDHVETAVGLFPGQGGYRRGALASFRENRETAVLDAFAAVDAAAKAVLGKQVSDRVFTADPPSPEDLFALDPDVLQLAVFAVSVGTFGALRARGARLDVLMGHSMGEVAALVCADAFTVDDGAELLCHRIAATTAAAGPSGGMVSLGCAEERAQGMVDLIDGDLVIAAVNGPEQVVVSGRPADLRSLEGVAAAVGVTASWLLAPHAFHSPWMSQARVEVRRRIHGYRQRPLRSPVFSPINGRLYRDGDNLLDQLSLHLVAPVRFGPAVVRLYDAGARIFVEVGAGSALTGLVRSAFPAATTLAPVAGGDEGRTLTAATAFLAPPGLQDR